MSVNGTAGRFRDGGGGRRLFAQCSAEVCSLTAETLSHAESAGVRGG
jgi:hypothetical protein